MQTVQTDARPPQIIPALDGIRGIAILLVMGLHYTIRYSTLASPLARAIRTPLQLGWCGVDVFFVLSGFLITGILLRERGQQGYYRNFYMRRVLRIFPLYYFVLFVVFVIGPLVPAVNDADFQRVQGLQGWLWSYLTNVAIARDLQWDFNTEYVRLGHLWSLAIEEHFYFVWPWLVAVLPPRSLLRAGVGIIVATTLLRIGMAALHVDPLAGYVLTPTRGDALVLGGCVAILVRDPASLARLRRFAVPALVVGPLLVLGVVPITHSTQTTYWPMQIIGFPAIAAAAAGLIVIGYTAQAGGIAHTVLGSRLLTTVGKYSYGAYVYHQLVQPIAERAFAPERFGRYVGEAGGLVIHVVLSMALALVVAMVSWGLFEKRMLSLKRYFEYKVAPLPAGAGGLGGSAGERPATLERQ